MKYDIFISYRRKGGYETAKHLYDLFSKDGYRVSFDLDTLRNGDFDQALLKRIDQCSDFILILSKGAFARTLDPAFNPRQDWLRIELAYALKKQKNIIPILLEGFEGFPENLPADIKDVAKKNGPQYNQYYFDEFYKKLKTDFLETRKSRFFSLKTILILSALILCAGGIWWYLQEVSGKQCILSKNNTINKSDTLKTESPDSPATPLTSGKEKKDPATPEQNTKKSQDVQPVTSVKLPDWMFAPTQKFIGIAPASLPARGAKEFAVATAAYQWVIAQGKPISGRDTTIESADVKKSHFHLFTPQIAFEYKIEHETQLSSGERVFEIVFFNSKRNPNTLQLISSIIDEKNNFEQTIKINYTGFEQIKTYEFNIVDEDGNKLARSYLNNTELKSPQTTVYTNAGNFLVPSRSSQQGHIVNLKLEDYHSLSKAWEYGIFSYLFLSPTGIIPCQIKSISRSDGSNITVAAYNDDYSLPSSMSCKGVKNNVLAISYEHNEQKVAEFIKEDSIKKAIANDLKEIENLDIK